MIRSTLSTLVAAFALGAAVTRLLTPRYSFAGRVVAITGGSRGLGLALARRFAADGARVALLARDRAELGRACADLRQRGNSEVLAIACDVRRADGATVEYNGLRGRRPAES